VSELRFTDGGRSLLTVADDFTVHDWRTGRVVRRYRYPHAYKDKSNRDNYNPVSISADGRVLAVADGGTMRLVDARTGEALHTLDGNSKFSYGGLLSADGKRLFTRDGDSTLLWVWDVATGKELRRVKDAGGHCPGLCAVSPDGKLLAESVGSREPGESVVRFWDVDRGREMRSLRVKGLVGRFVFSPDGTVLAADTVYYPFGPEAETAILLWDVAAGRQLRSLTGYRGPVFDMAFSPDGRALVAGGWDRTVRLWEVASGKERHRFTGHKAAVVSLAFSPDGRLVAAASMDAPVYVWDVTGGAGRRPAPAAPAGAEGARLWEGLADPDAAAAFQVMRRLAARPDEAVALVRERLKPVPADGGRVRRLIRDLDADDFGVRERATAELGKVVDQVEGALRAAREGGSLEVRRRIDAILSRLWEPTPERLRQARALEVLEWLGTPEAGRLLEGLSAGAAGARLTSEAAAARERVRRRSGR
jgi:dipeptidyl aminopeptidase/acylaminoacyl peptidase